MTGALFDQGSPAIHARLRTTEGQRALATEWKRPGALRIADVLAPGLAAELVPFIRSLPHIAGAGANPPCILWGAELAVPDQPRAQYPMCMFAVRRFLDDDLPDLVSALTGCDYARAKPGQLRVWLLRKGCYLDGSSHAPPGEMGFILGLNGPSWPAEWGGHVEVTGEDASVSLPPGADTLDLIAGHSYRIPLITHQIEAMMITGTLRAA